MSGLPKLVLIQPPLSDPNYPGVPFRFEPLSLLAVAAATPKDLFEVRIIDGTESVDTADLVDPSAALVGITVVEATAKAAYRIAGRYRELKIPVVLGGTHITLDPEDATGKADALVVGEIEEGWREVLLDARTGRLKPRYAFAAPESIDLEMDRGIIPDYARQYRFISAIQTTRGCPNSCVFCVPSVCYGRRIRHRPVSSVVAEVSRLKTEYGRKFIGFTDDNLTADRKYSEELFRALIPLKIRWASQVCIDVAKDEKLLDLAVKSGCIGLFVGLESPRQEALNEAGKEYRAGEYHELLSRIRARGIAVIASFTIGYDTDDDSVYDDILEFCRKEEIEFPLFVSLMAYKGLPLYDRLKKQGRQMFEHEAIHPLVTNFALARMDRAAMPGRMIEMYTKYYTIGYVLRNLWRSVIRLNLLKTLQFLMVLFFYARFAREMRSGRFATSV